MQKVIVTVMLIALPVLGPAISSAQESGEMKGPTMGKDMMTGMHPMRKMMMDKSLVATEDGGVIVMMGNKLFKYDKNLNLKKEVELEIDMGDMQKMMMQMKEKCPAYKKMMQESGMIRETTEEPKGLPESEKASEHESHH